MAKFFVFALSVVLLCSPALGGGHYKPSYPSDFSHNSDPSSEGTTIVHSVRPLYVSSSQTVLSASNPTLIKGPLIYKTPVVTSASGQVFAAAPAPFVTADSQGHVFYRTPVVAASGPAPILYRNPVVAATDATQLVYRSPLLATGTAPSPLIYKTLATSPVIYKTPVVAETAPVLYKAAPAHTGFVYKATAPAPVVYKAPVYAAAAPLPTILKAPGQFLPIDTVVAPQYYPAPTAYALN